MTDDINNEKVGEKREKCSIMEFAGIWKDIDTDKMIEEIYNERKIGSRRFQ